MTDITEDHMPYIWAAYRRGLFPMIPEDLGAAEFEAVFMNILVDEIRRGNRVSVSIGRTDQGEIPLGFNWVHMIGTIANPHVIWFPEAGARNKIELMARFLLSVKSESFLLVNAPADLVGFFSHLGRYGILRRVGTLKKVDDGKDVVLFQGVI